MAKSKPRRRTKKQVIKDSIQELYWSMYGTRGRPSDSVLADLKDIQSHTQTLINTLEEYRPQGGE